MNTVKLFHLLEKNVPYVFFVSLLFVFGCNKNKENHDIYGGRKPAEISIDQMIFIDTEIGFALIDLTKIDSSSVSYRWRSWNEHFENERHGEGHAEEKYATIMKTDSVSHAIDTGSDLLINAGQINVLWSPNTPQSISVFYHPEKASIKILKDDTFNTFNQK